jgi:hypothetical protein
MCNELDALRKRYDLAMEATAETAGLLWDALDVLESLAPENEVARIFLSNAYKQLGRWPWPTPTH